MGNPVQVYLAQFYLRPADGKLNLLQFKILKKYKNLLNGLKLSSDVEYWANFKNRSRSRFLFKNVFKRHVLWGNSGTVFMGHFSHIENS